MASSGPPSRACSSSTPTTSPPASARRLELVGIAVRRAKQRPLRPARRPVAVHHRRRRLVKRADIVIEVIGGIEPARSLILQRHEARRLGRVAPTRRCSPRTAPTLYAAADRHGVDLYYEAAVAGAIPILRPIRESPRRRRRAPGARHRQRHHQLRPRQDGHHRRRVRRGRRAGPGARLRRGRPHRRRRGLRRRGQGRHPRLARLPHPGLQRRRPPRGHHRGHAPADIQAAKRDGLRRQAARDLRAHRSTPTARDPASACACTRR